MARRLARLTLRLAAVGAVALLLAELGLRCVLFCSGFDGTPLAWRLRQPGLYAHPQQGDLHWHLSSRWSGRGDPSVPGYDPRLGWVGHAVLPGYDHQDRERLQGRRPVLLFGDSYAQCNTPPRECFQELLEEHSLGRTHRIVNYGLGGYGLDQIYLLLKASLDVWEKDRPLVLVGVMVDDDLDRAILSMRDWPKPRLGLRDGELVLPPGPVPTLAGSREQAPFVPSYLALRLRHRKLSRLWNGYQAPEHVRVWDEELKAEKQALARALFLAIEAELSGRGIPHAYVLFHNELAVLRPELTGWRDGLAREVLDGLGARWYSASDALLERADDSQVAIADFFGREGPLIGHYNAQGNEAALESMVQAICDLEGLPNPRERVPLRPWRFHGMRTGKGGSAQYSTGPPAGPFELPVEDRRLVFLPGSEGACEVEYDLAGRVESFRARVRQLPLPRDPPDCGSARLTLLADGEVLHQHTYRRGDPPRELNVELSGHRSLIVRVDDAGDGASCDRIVLGSPTFR